MNEGSRLVRRAPVRPLVWLGEKGPASDVAPSVGARFPATVSKEKDFVLSIPRREER